MREYLEYGENKEGYWTSEKCLKQMDRAINISEIKYPRDQGYRHYWIFDCSGLHAAFGEDALNAYHMNAKPGGKQPKMRDTIWNGKLQKMNFSNGTPLGCIIVLREKGISTRGMKLNDMHTILSSHADFKNEKTKLEHYLQDCGQGVSWSQNSHCEMNPIERCWAQVFHRKFEEKHPLQF